MQKITKNIFLTLIVVALGLVGFTHRGDAKVSYVQSSTPTIFVHGWGSSSHAEEKMANAARDAGVTKTIVRANVDKKGNVTFNRQIPANAVNPIVEVNLEDNKLAGYQDDYAQGYRHGGTYVKNVVVALQKQHHYKQINLVGHSMGNLEIINYINDNVNNKKLPKVAHLVAIAGHYNGLVGEREAEAKVDAQTGEPEQQDSAYRGLLGLRQTFPKNTAVLNIYGDVGDGSHSDEDVPVNSAKSLKYLVADRAKSYQEIEIHGKNAQHSKLHDNSQVNKALIKFLWEK
ncbi:alpha/beta hydrolase [Limosilactobacillus caviae]|uniref:Alpha/beta hydrolase n=1 Tax=Limosilactobacillus caviae TaxID=1769424 RepID=A0ABQ2C2L2_9LACO|nr:alpha/beta hydrolase [Limosilactobacillus caviae]MCD7124841.1 alpha/beta hydrolase [Limosilactobacillus caviae]MRH45519.1 alpha/beta hydrolase [Limosilactobacillus reuteri]GGI62355.1 alpha/beta hydrolase [Limosilactobacillus caviae]